MQVLLSGKVRLAHNVSLEEQAGMHQAAHRKENKQESRFLKTTKSYGSPQHKLPSQAHRRPQASQTAGPKELDFSTCPRMVQAGTILDGQGRRVLLDGATAPQSQPGTGVSHPPVPSPATTHTSNWMPFHLSF